MFVVYNSLGIFEIYLLNINIYYEYTFLFAVSEILIRTVIAEIKIQSYCLKKKNNGSKYPKLLSKKEDKNKGSKLSSKATV